MTDNPPVDFTSMRATTPLNIRNRSVLLSGDMDKDQFSRLRFFVEWLNEQRIPWYQPDLTAYRDYLLTERQRRDARTGENRPALLSPIAANAHLATIRGRYRQILRDNRLRNSLYETIAPEVSAPADRKALVDEVVLRLRNAIHPENSQIDETHFLDRPDGDHLRLTPDQVQTLLRQPGLKTLTGLRDTAIIALLVCTGIREAELVALTVDDLREQFGGELALRIRDGKDNKQRLIPYGPLDWCLLYVDKWLAAANIRSGPVFRGLYKGAQRTREGAISMRAINQIMNHYPIVIGGVLRVVQPHDLRRTYARAAYLNGMDFERLRQNLGHASLQTTQQYVGTLDAVDRRPPAMFTPPHKLSDLG
jgi:integrase